MFFNRLGSKSCECSKMTHEGVRRYGRRPWAMLSLAALLAVPATLLPAQDSPAGSAATTARPAAAPADNAALLKKGVQEYQNNQYEEAVATLKQVKADSLSASDKRTLSDTLAKAEPAAAQRQAARAEFQKGQDALKAKKPGEAIAHYEKAAENKFADKGTASKAREQIALAQDLQKQESGNLKALYTQAVKEEDTGHLSEARAKFVTLAAAGYKTGLFEKSPQDFVKDIDRKLAETAAAASEQNAKASYDKAKSEYNKGDWIAARRNFEAAKKAGYKPGLFEDSPETYLARMDRKEQADAAKHQQEIARQRQAEADKTRIAQANVMVAKERSEQTKAQQVLDQHAAANPQASNTAGAKAPAGTAVVTVAATDSKTAPAAQPKAASTAAQPAAAPAKTASVNAAPVDSATAAANAALDRAANMDQIRKQQAQYEAQSLVQQARDAQAAGQNDTALKLYIQAADLDPSNEQAQAGRRELMSITGRATAPTPQLSERAQEIKVQRQAIQYSFRQSIDAAQKAIADQNFGEAKNQINSARLAAARNPQVFSEQEIREFDAQIDNTNLALQRATQESQAKEKQAAAEAAAKRAGELDRESAKRRQDSVAALVRESMRLVQEAKYTAALGVIDQILVLDPNNDYALGTRPLVQDKSNFQEQRRFREEFDQQMTRQLNAAEERKIPYDDIYRYPANWPDIVETREKSVKEEQGLKDVDQVVQAQLDRRLPEVRFDGVALTDVIDFMRDITGANIFVNWRALEAAGVDKNAPVTARLRDVKFSKALSTILQDVGGTTARLTYTIDEGVITISTAEDLSKNVVTRVYDIRDVLIDVPDFDNAPDFNLSDISNQGNNGNNGGNGGGGGGGNNQGLFGGQQNQGQNQEQAGQSRQERIDQIIKLIQDTVASDSWKDNGGTVGSVRELSGQLIVTQTPENQLALRGLLEQLRETRAIQVTIETRFLTVQRNFLEDIGLDFDFSFNNLGKVSSSIGPIQISQNSADFTASPTTPAPGSLGGTVQPSLQTNSFSYGSGGAGGLGAGTFLDDFQASFLIRATQASSTSTILTSPRVTLFNGQRAYVLVATQTAYVSDLTPVVGSGAVAFDPTISTVQSGVKLDVQATVSSDRKYVTLTLQPQLANLIALLSFQFQTVTPVAGGGTNPGIPGGTGGNIISTGSTTTAGNGIVQQPILQITEVRTTVSVPDGGTLLLGGQTIAGEVEKEAGVPVLSKIPFLKRLFTNRSTAKDDQVLLILVKPTIIIQREEEQRQFPLLSSKVGS